MRLMFGLFKKNKVAKGPRNEAAELTKKLSRSAIIVSAAVVLVFIVLLYLLILIAQVVAVTLSYNSYTANSALFISEHLNETMRILEECPDPMVEGDAMNTIRQIVQLSPNIYGSGIALTPEASRKWDGTNSYLIYACEDPETKKVVTKHIDRELPDFNYMKADWFQIPVTTGKNHWSNPYRGNLVGDSLICTCSHPLHDRQGNRVGVMFLDMAVNEGIRQMLSPIYKDKQLGKDFTMALMSSDKTVIIGDTTTVDTGVMASSMPIEGTDWELVCHIMYTNNNFFRLWSGSAALLFFIYLLIVASIYFSVRFTMKRLSRSDVQRQMRRLTELDVAGKIQQGMLPKGDMQMVAAVMIPAKEVGGDLYNYFEEDDRLYFIIGDVSGKGVPAALVMSIATHLFRSIAPNESDPAAIVEKINNQMSRDNSTSMFITMIVGILDKKNDLLLICNAGHNPPFFDGKFMQLKANIATGVCENIEYHTHTMPFPKGSRIVLYTDGVTEAMNARHQQYGTGRLMSILQSLCSRNDTSEQDICDAIVNDVHRFADKNHQSDDITVVVISN